MLPVFVDLLEKHGRLGITGRKNAPIDKVIYGKTTKFSAKEFHAAFSNYDTWYNNWKTVIEVPGGRGHQITSIRRGLLLTSRSPEQRAMLDSRLRKSGNKGTLNPPCM